MVAIPVAMSGRDPSDSGWYQSWFWTSVTHGQSGVSEAGHPNCLDLGQACVWSQQRTQAIGLANLCQDTFTHWGSRFCDRRLRIWLGGSPEMARSLALVVCFALKVGHLPLAGAIQRMETIRQLSSRTRPKSLAGPRVLDCERDLPNQSADPLAGGRRRTLVLGHQSP